MCPLTKRDRILLVDDEPSITQSFELGLKQFGFDFTRSFPTRHFIKKPISLDKLASELKEKINEDYQVIG